jgi:hypothetical protein
VPGFDYQREGLGSSLLDPRLYPKKSLSSALSQARQWQITGNALELKDDTDTSLALFEAVYLR